MKQRIAHRYPSGLRTPTKLIAIALFGVLSASTAIARDAFVTALEPCLEIMKAPPQDPRYQFVLDQGWTAGLFAIAEKDGGGLGTDLCGELGGGGLEFGGAYAWPESLGELKAIDASVLTPEWLERAIRNARASAESPKAAIQRVTVTALPEDGAQLVRVYFAVAEAQAEAPPSVDLNAAGEVIARDARVPDEFVRKLESDADPASVAETSVAPSVDPRGALVALLAGTQAKPDAMIVRLTLSSFNAGLVYRNGANAPIRQTQYNFIEGSASGLEDAVFDFPAAFKACSMTLKQVQSAVENVAKQKRYQNIAKRLQHLLLECSEQKPSPHWSLVALEPFEYFDLPAQF